MSKVLSDTTRPHFLSYPLLKGVPTSPSEGFADLWSKFIDPSKLVYAFRGRDAPAQDSTLDGSSLSDHAAVLCVADLRDPAVGRASTRRGDGQSRPAPGTARHPFLVV